MHNTLVSWLTRFANHHTMRNRSGQYIYGILDVYQFADRMSHRKGNEVSFDSLVKYLAAEFERLQTEHNLNLSFSAADLRNALASFHISRGNGSRPYVRITTPDGRQNLKTIMDAKTESNKRLQDVWLSEFVSVDSDTFERIPLVLNDELLSQTVN